MTLYVFPSVAPIPTATKTSTISVEKEASDCSILIIITIAVLQKIAGATLEFRPPPFTIITCLFNPY